MLEEGPNNDWLNDQTVFICAIVMAVGAASCSSGAPSRPSSRSSTSGPSRNINFAFGSLFSFVLGIGLYGLTYLYPVYLGRIRGYDSLMIGETLFVIGPGDVPHRADRRHPVAQDGSAADDDDRASSALPPAPGSMTHLTADWDFWELLIPQILRGCSD